MNSFTSRLSLSVPIVLAPMGGAVGPELAAAVTNAGGLGMIPLWWMTPDEVKDQIRAVRSLTSGPFGVNLNLRFPQEDRLTACIDEGVTLISFFWGLSTPMIERAKSAGMFVLQTVGSAAEARRAVAAGADSVVAQGWEAGGHVWGTVATIALVPAVVDAVGEVPVIAAGGIADGRGLAAVLALGASAAWIGTRFLASTEATVNPRYRELLFAAHESDTYFGSDVFDLGWENAPHRALRNKTVIAWEEAGRPAPGSRPGEGEVIARSPGGDILRYSFFSPGREVEGDLDALALWSGQGVALVSREQPASDIVVEIWNEARATMRGLSGLRGELGNARRGSRNDTRKAR